MIADANHSSSSASPATFWNNISLTTRLALSIMFVIALVVATLAYFASATATSELISSLGNGLRVQGESAVRGIANSIENEAVSGLRAFSLDGIVQDSTQAANDAYTGLEADIQRQLQSIDQQWINAGDADPLIQSLLNNDIASELKEYSSTFPDHVEMFVTDRYGALIGSTRRTSDYFQADESWWQETWNNGAGSIYVGQPELDDSAGMTTMIVAVPIFAHDESGAKQLIGVMRSTFNFAAIAAQLNELNFGTGSGAHLFLNAELEYHTESGELEPIDPARLDVRNRLLDQSYGEVNLEESDVLASLIPLNSVVEAPYMQRLNWELLVSADRAFALQPVTATTRNILLVGALVLGVGFVVGVFLSRSITNPILRLTQATRAFTAGNFQQRAAVAGTDEIGVLASSFNTMAEQIQSQVDTLEANVELRTRDLETVTEVSAQISTVLDTRHLLRDISNLTKERFGLYHAHIYLLDESKQTLVLTAGAGEVGQQMVGEGRTIQMDNKQSIVAAAARNNQGVIINDVRESPTFLPHRLLPDTRSELAMPLTARGQMIGVLDVQSDQTNYFNNSSYHIIELMARQIAVAISNATAYDETQSRLRNVQAANQIASFLRQDVDMELMLEHVVDVIRDTFEADNAVYSRFDPNAQRWQGVVGAGQGMTSEIARTFVDPAGRYPHALAVVRSGDVVAVNDAHQYPDFPPEFLDEKIGVKSVLVLPVLSGRAVMGVIFLNFNQVYHPFSAEEIDLARGLANQLSSGLERFAAEESSRVAREEAEALYRVTTLINEANDEQAIVRAITEQIIPKEAFSISMSIYEGGTLDNPEYNRIIADWNRFGGEGVSTGMLIPMNSFMAESINSIQSFSVQNNIPEDRTLSDEAREAYASLGVTSVMSATISVAGRRFGSISVAADTPYYFTDRDQRLFRTVAEQAAVAVERINLSRQTAKRAAELETVAQVSAAAASIRDADILLKAVVDLTKERFGLYHAHIYLLDEAGENLVLAAGAGEAGNIMKERGHQIPLNRENSLVAKAAREQRGVIVNDVTQEPDFLPNPLLPDTRSELAIPLILADRLIGVLDVQDVTTNRFTESDVQVQAALADQIAVAISNATAYSETQSRLRNVQAANQIANFLRQDVDREFMLEQVVDVIRDTFEADNAVYSRFDPNAQLWQGVVGAGQGMTSELARTFVDPGARYPHALAAVRSGDVVAVNDAHQYPDFPPEFLDEKIGVKSVLVLPVLSGRAVTGVIFLNFNQVYHPFTAEEIDLARGLANQLSSGLERFAAEESIRAAREEAEALYRVTTLINEANDEQAIVRAITEQIIPKEAFSISMSIYEGGTLDNPENIRIIADWNRLGGEGVSTGMLIPMNSFMAESINSIQSFLVQNNIPADGTLSDEAREAYAGLGVTSLMSATISVAGRRFGSIAVAADTPYYFTDRDQRLFRTVAEQAAVAVERINLSRQTAKRAAELETVAQVSAAAASIRDADILLDAVVDLTKYSFDLYHAHIYLLDEAGENLVLAAGAGEAGNIMKERGHQIPLNRENSLVAKAAREQRGVIVNDVTQEPDFLPNPLLPDTRSELAIPLILADRLIGVLDVQDVTTNRFTESDVQVQAALADQIAVAVENARAFREQERTAERLREVDRLKSQFLANMSHELRTPLNSIIGYAEVLLDGIDGELTEDAIEDVQAIHGGGRHLLTIINDILDLAKIEAGQMFVDRRETDLMPTIGEVFGTCDILARNKGLELKFEAPDKLPAVHGDPIRLKQIILNLVNNAIKFTDAGSVTVSVEETADQQLLVRVRDTGMGMTPDEIGGLFQQFHQVDGSPTRRAGGTGLGLVITRHLVHMHEGQIDVESEKGAGSTFWFTVPVFVPTTEPVGGAD